MGSSGKLVSTTDIVAGAVSQSAEAVGTTSGPTSVATSLADVLEMTVTLTTFGGDVLVWFSVAGSHSDGNATVTVAIRRDAGTDDALRNQTVSNANHIRVFSTFKRYTGLAAGTYTWKGRASNDIGATLTFAGVNRSIMAQEIKR